VPASLFYSPNLLEVEFCELRVDGVLRSSSLSHGELVNLSASFVITPGPPTGWRYRVSFKNPVARTGNFTGVPSL
jgi:hypothetical protein